MKYKTNKIKQSMQEKYKKYNKESTTNMMQI